VRSALIAACAVVACSSSDLRVDRVTPAYGPLAGGTRITLEGNGFWTGARVLVGDRVSPLAAASHDGSTLEVVIPPSDRPGPTSIAVLSDTAAVTLPDSFRYTTRPTIASVSPAKVLPSAITPTVVTLTGSGFADDGAGTVTVLVDGIAATDVIVHDDSTVTFVPPDGAMLVQPTIQLLDDRGTASFARAFRYVPTEHPSLLLFPNYTGELAVLYDLVDHVPFSIPRSTQLLYRFTTVVVDGGGEYWAFDRARRFGRLDFVTGQIADPLTAPTFFSAMTRVGSQIIGIDRYTFGLDRLDPSTGTITRIGADAVGCCGGFGIAADGDTVYVTHRNGIDNVVRTFDLDTGQLGTPVTLTGPPTFQIEELRVVDHVMYAASRDGTLCTIDPTTGMVTVVANISRANAFDVLP
jgi:hypothetical protein